MKSESTSALISPDSRSPAMLSSSLRYPGTRWARSLIEGCWVNQLRCRETQAKISACPTLMKLKMFFDDPQMQAVASGWFNGATSTPRSNAEDCAHDRAGG